MMGQVMKRRSSRRTIWLRRFIFIIIFSTFFIISVLIFFNGFSQLGYVTTVIPAYYYYENQSKPYYNSNNQSLLTLDESSHDWKKLLILESRDPIIIGQSTPELKKKYLAIGIPTIFREANYLNQTLSSFIGESSLEERENVTIILYVADLDLRKRNTQIQLITSQFQPFLDSGFLQIIYTNSPSAIYPQLKNFTSSPHFRRTYNDPANRVQWRTKQVLDFAYLLSYASTISEYFMVMEDDLIAAPAYLTSIKKFIETRNKDEEKNWIALEFTQFVGIGLLFHTSMIGDMANFLLLFYEDQPVDYLMREFIKLQVPDAWSVQRRIPSVFQHFGLNSTLENKSQQLIDFSFESARRRYNNSNPPAILSTTLNVHAECFLQNAYEQTPPGLFWGNSSPSNKTDELITIKFNATATGSPVLVSKIIILTGMIHQNTKTAKPELKDFIKAGELQFSQELNCSKYEQLESFNNKHGELDITLFIPTNITCLQIVISRTSSWIVIREIEIFTENSTNKLTPFL